MMMPVADPGNQWDIGAAKLGCAPMGDAARCHVLAAIAWARRERRRVLRTCRCQRKALIAPALETHLTCTPHLMGEMLVRDIWDPHARVLRDCQWAQ